MKFVFTVLSSVLPTYGLEKKDKGGAVLFLSGIAILIIFNSIYYYFFK